MNKIIFTLLCIAMSFLNVNAQDMIEGVWYNTLKTGKVEIVKKNDKFYGKIVWLKEPLDEKTNKPKTDINNPESAKHKDPIIGLQVLKDFVVEKKGLYVNGKIYDPENGKTYSCKMTLKDENNLDVRGFVGVALLGRTENWTRAK